MKVRKGTIKRPKFLINYTVSLIIVLIIFMSAAAFFCLAYYMEYLYEADHESDLFSLSEATNAYIYENGHEKEKLSVEDINKIKSGLIGLYLSTGQRARLYIRDVGMIDSSQAAILYHTDYGDQPENGEFNTDKVRSYTLRLADEKYMEYFNAPEIKEMRCIDDHGAECFEQQPVLQFICNKYYVNLEKGLFIPVEVEICTANAHTNFKPTGKIINIDPGNTDGFTLVIMEKGVNANLGEAAGYEGVDNDADYTNESNNEGGLVYKTEYTDKKMIPFTLKYKTRLTNALVAIIWAAAVFAFIPATVSYNVRMRRYQIFEYRLKMIDAMAHDLKTPMAAVSAYAENLSNNIATDKKEYYADKIVDKVSQMNKMVSDILEFSKSEKSSGVIKKEDTDIGGIIDEIISDNEHSVNERSLKINFDKKSVIIKTDPQLFRQAVSNLIGNAVLYSKEGTEIDIACDDKTLTITNIPAEKIGDVKDLKKPFEKGDTTRGNKGTGLGLAIANNNLAMLGFKLGITAEDGKFTATVKM